MGDGSSIEERAKIRCGTCGAAWTEHDHESICWRYRPVEAAESRTIGYVSVPTNGHATQKDAMIEHVDLIVRQQTIGDLQKILSRLGTIEADLRAVPDAGDRLNVARHGVGLAMEFVEREIQRLKGD